MRLRLGREARRRRAEAGVEAVGVAPVAEAAPEVEPAPAPAKPSRPSWAFEEGAEIAEGRSILKSLGGGSRYEVYLVWDDVLFAIAVAKILRPDQAEDDHALRELAREAELLQRLAHPGIVRSFDAVLEGPTPHVLLEHLEGPSLRRLIRQAGPLPLMQLLPLALHVASTIQYLARTRVVHLDVKPDNIIMGVPPRLIDLSIARSLERAANTSGAVGTDAYMPPEQCDPDSFKGLIGPASDVWGLGATLFHAASGSVPFPRPKGAREGTLHDRFPQLLRDPQPLPGHLPPELRELILASLSRDPAERPTAVDVAERLQPLVADLPRRMRLTRGGPRLH